MNNCILYNKIFKSGRALAHNIKELLKFGNKMHLNINMQLIIL